ncbi:MAG: hypothetical protein NWE83_10175 [Candidatus Bathyarchaeota archaeon]|jgi:hypothetical protein|nr:hypothetical protein [Candidatus Bathyarchaeota archaeon]
MKIQYIIKAIDIVVCLIGAGLMFNGNIFGDRTTGIATIAGIVGISIISASARKLRGR